MQLRQIGIVLITLFSQQIFAQNTFDRLIDQEKELLTRINQTSTRSTDKNAPTSCKIKYKDLFSKRKVRILLALGYGDTGSDTVLDFFSHAAFKRKLTEPCGPDNYSCGFRVSKKEPDLLVKAESDPTGEKNHIIEIKLIRGAYTHSDSKNVSKEVIDTQNAYCEATTIKFFAEVASGTDVIIYSGHSRNGGGPDFCPPNRKSDQHVNYPWYETNRPGMQTMLGSMKIAVNAGKPNKVIAMLSCSSHKHFYKDLLKVNPTAGYLLTKRLASFAEVTQDAYATLDSLLSQRCEDGFKMSFDERGATAWKNMF